jgi:aromatic-L-amino-acid decarboxylase
MGDILSSGIASIGFSWKSSPAMTELEMAMTDWLAKATGLPDVFLSSHPGPGAGMIQNTASDATFVAILSARARAIHRLKATENTPTSDSSSTDLPADVVTFDDHDPALFTRLVAYCSDQAHSAFDKNAALAGVRMRKLKSAKDKQLGNFTVLPETFEEAIKEDTSKGLVPFIFVATVGTTNTCGVDWLDALGPICNREKVWLHVDAAYAGSYLLCDEFRYLSKGVEYVDSFNFNCHKTMMVNFDCSPMWFKDAAEAIKYFHVDPIFLRHEHQAVASDYRHLQIALGRRFRSIKIWFVLRAFGLEKIKEHLRKMVRYAEQFEKLIEGDERFKMFVPRHLSLVCFRIKGDNALNERLCNALNTDGRIHLVPGSSHDVTFLRFAIGSSLLKDEDIQFSFNVIQQVAENVLKEKA